MSGDMVEPAPVPDVFVSGLGAIEDVGGGCLRFIFYVLQRPLGGGPPEKVVVAKIISPACGLPDTVAMMVDAVTSEAGAQIATLAAMVN